MPDPVEIWNGPYLGQPLGRLAALDGHEVLIWTDSPVELVSAMVEAIGRPPAMPPFGLGGYMEVSGATAAGPWGPAFPVMSYNPAGDVINTALAAEFASVVAAYNARVAAVQAAVLAILQMRTAAAKLKP